MFEIGDLVTEIETGDVGEIVQLYFAGDEVTSASTAWMVLWKTGSSAGRELWITEDSMTKISNSDNTSYDTQASINKLAALLAQGQNTFTTKDLKD